MKEFVEVPTTRVKRALISGVGVNDAPYNVNNNGLRCPYYNVWHHMIQRCYEPTKGWEDCIVCKEWQYFMIFRKWMESQDWKNLYLDKDILVFGNKEYGPNTCVFVTNYVNSLFTQTKKRKLPKGINLHSQVKRYTVQCSIKPAVQKYLGLYTSLEEANKVYIEAKTKVLDEIVKTITDVRVIDGLYKQLSNLDKENKIVVENYNDVSHLRL